jgi:hypothetical protein
VRLSDTRLLVGDDRFFLRGIRHSGTPLKVLREAGFNTVWLDETTPPGLLEDAVNLGFWIVPTLRPPETAERLGSPAAAQAAAEQFGKQVSRFLDQDALICWDLGTNRSALDYDRVRSAATAFREADPNRPLAVDVWDDFFRYSKNVEQVMLGLHRWPLLTTLELPAYHDWLVQRRHLAAPRTYCWSWVQTHLPPWALEKLYDKAGPGGITEPVGPQPEQIRLLSYIALGAGCRGLAFWSDRFLADSHSGRDRLLALGLLNLELQLLEPLLLDAEEHLWIDSTVPEMRAAVLYSKGAVLVLPMWLGKGAQFVPGQSAAAEVSMVVPDVPKGYAAWEVTPGRVRSLQWTRVMGGVKVILPEPSLATAIVLTDNQAGPDSLIVQFQNRQRDMARRAARWAVDQAQEELAKVELVQAELSSLGHADPASAQFLQKARDLHASSVARLRDGQYEEAYVEADRALRPLRMLMRAEWERAVRDLDSPVSSPYTVSFYTLPRHWRFYDELSRHKLGANVLPGGGFEGNDAGGPQWLIDATTRPDPVKAEAKREEEKAVEGKRCLVLRVTPEQKPPPAPPTPPPAALERTFLAVHSPAVKLPPGSLVRISAWARVATQITGSPDGAMLYDSAGGEPLAVRLSYKDGKWRRYTLFRRVPESGLVSVTLALTGMGTVCFDDVRIEPLVPATGPAPQGAPQPQREGGQASR